MCLTTTIYGNRVHEMHKQINSMTSVVVHSTINVPLSSSGYPTMIFTHPLAHNSSTKLWLLGDCKQTHAHTRARTHTDTHAHAHTHTHTHTHTDTHTDLYMNKVHLYVTELQVLACLFQFLH